MKKALFVSMGLFLIANLIFAGGTQEGGTTDRTKSFVCYAWGDGHMDIYKEMEAEFNNNYPGNEFTYEQDTTLTDFLVTRAAQNNLPDLFYTNPYTGVSDWASGGRLYDLSNQPWIKSLPQSVQEGISYEGTVYAFPYSVCYTGYFYNMDIFSELGLSVPKTVSEFRQVNETLKSAGYNPIAIGGGTGSNWVLQQLFASLCSTALGSDTKDFADTMNEGKNSFHNIPGIENVKEMLDMSMLEYNLADPMSVDYSAMLSSFASEESAIYHNGSWSISDVLKANPDIKVGFFGYPISEDPNDAAITYDVEIALVMSNNTQNVGGCLEFLDYLSDSDGGAAMITKQSRIPVAKANISEENVSKTYTNAMDYVSSGKTTQWLHWLTPVAFNDDFGADLQDYVMGNVNFNQLLDKADAKWASHLE